MVCSKIQGFLKSWAIYQRSGNRLDIKWPRAIVQSFSRPGDVSEYESPSKPCCSLMASSCYKGAEVLNKFQTFPPNEQRAGSVCSAAKIKSLSVVF